METSWSATMEVEATTISYRGILVRLEMHLFSGEKGWLPIAKLKKIYKDRLDSGVTWLK